MALSDNSRGAAIMALSMAAFILNDTCMKVATETLAMPTPEATALRNVAVILGLLLLAPRMGGLRLGLPRAQARLVALRSVGEILSTGAFLYALKHMPLANLSAIMQSLPLAVTLGAALFLQEPLGWRRTGAILIGFVGVLLIVKPGPVGFDGWSLSGLAAVAAVTLRDLSTRRLSRDVPSITVAIYAAGSVSVAAALFAGLDGGWPPVPPRAGLLLLTAAACLVVGYIAAVAAMRVGEVGIVAPFRYTSLLYAIVLGGLVFGQLPGPVTLAGAGIVVATGLFTLYRERQLRRAARGAVPIRG